MERGKREAWIYFNEIEVDAVLRGECKKCEESVMNNLERLKTHLNKSPGPTTSRGS